MKHLPQAVLGEFQVQLYNSSLLFSLLPLPGNGFSTQDMKAARVGCHSPIQVEGPCHCQSSTRNRLFWSCNMYLPVPFSAAVNEIFFFMRSRCLQCRCFHLTYLSDPPITVNVKTEVLLFVQLFLS